MSCVESSRVELSRVELCLCCGCVVVCCCLGSVASEDFLISHYSQV